MASTKRPRTESVCLSSEQEEAIEAVRSGKNVFVTGCAGTGKSLLIKRVVKECSHMRVSVTAPTGIAAANIDGYTLNFFAGILLGDQPKEKLLELARKYAKNRWMSVGLLIIDEVSMLSAELFDKLEWIARKIRGCSKPFGGIQIMLVGDFFQLPPVNAEYCFFAESWGKVVECNVVLTRVYRQNESIMLDALEKLRKGEIMEEFKELVCREPVDREDGIKPTHLYAVNIDVDAINMRELNKLGTEIKMFKAKDEFYESNAIKEKDMHVPAELFLAVGAQVICLKNDSGMGVVNGSRGVVVGFAKDTGWPLVKFLHSAAPLEVGEHAFEIRRLGRKVGCRRIVPLKMGWAITIHKSQGLSIEYLHVDLRKVFSVAQTYVALSRAVTIEGLSVVGLKPEVVKVDPRVIEFYGKL